MDDFAEALEYNPRYIILVASPQNVTGDRLLEIGRLFQGLDYYPGLGIITGGTLDKAEQLWANRERARGGQNYLGGDYEPLQQVWAPTICNLSDGAGEEIGLNKESLLDTLGRAGFFFWSRHVGQRTWYWNSESQEAEEQEIVAADLPPLQAPVIYTPSCDSLRPWVENNIALGFVDHGAAAYLGNVNSGFHTSALLRRGTAIPGLSSWREFPLGLVAQFENQVEAKAYFQVPQFFMLGDPRIYLSPEQPYRITSDTSAAPGGQGDRGRISVSRIPGGRDRGRRVVRLYEGQGCDICQ